MNTRVHENQRRPFKLEFIYKETENGIVKGVNPFTIPFTFNLKSKNMKKKAALEA